MGWSSVVDQNETTNVVRPKKTVMKALKMSIIHVLAFIVSWTPYTVMGTWDTIHRALGYTSNDKVPQLMRDVLYLTAVLNSCINPIIYGVYYFSERNSRITGHRSNPAHRDTEVTSSFQTSRGVNNGQTRASSTPSRTNSLEMIDSSCFQEERQRDSVVVERSLF